MYKRKIEKKLAELTKTFPAVAVLGPRQSGKTTLVKSMFPDFAYCNLEDLNQRELAVSDPLYFLKSYQKNGGLIIDEAQHAPDLFSYIQLDVDEKKGAGRFVLTGSQNFLLNEQISQTLAGRVAILDLLPLSIGELKEAGQFNEDLDTALFKGCYPRIYQEKVSPSDWYLNYTRTYVERDVRKMINISDLSTFQRFLKLCAGRIGQLINFSDLGRDCGISYQTAKAWISLLEASFIIFTLPPFYKNFNKRVTKSKKLFFYDTGLACHLLQIESPSQIFNHYLRGGIFESYIISELTKQRFNQGKESNCYFWRDEKNHEVDCLLELGEVVLPIEIKSSHTFRKDFFKNLIYWSKLSHTPSESSYLIYGGDENQVRREGHLRSWTAIDAINS